MQREQHFQRPDREFVLPPPHLEDANGALYGLSFFRDDSLWILGVSDDGATVGRSYCWEHLADRTLEIRDIVVERKAIARVHFLTRCARRQLGLPPALRNYRGRGIGTALLRVVMDTARANGFCRVTGTVVPETAKDRARLCSWYLANGFSLRTSANQTEAVIAL